MPQLRVEFVGHPMIGRFANDDLRFTRGAGSSSIVNRQSQILLLPGSRKSELQRHLPVMLGCVETDPGKIAGGESQNGFAESIVGATREIARRNMEIQIGELPWALAEADVAIASTAR